MIRKLIAATLIAAAASLAVALPASAATHAATPAQKTCSAFTAWDRHQTAGNLGRLVITSAGLPRSYLKADVFSLAADASSPSPKAVKYVAKDGGYVRQDCAQ